MKKVLSRSTRSLLRQIVQRRIANNFDPTADYYKVLGVSDSATPTDIKTAYRKLVKIYHPDINKNGEAIFKEINAANEVLSNVTTRKDYDSQRTQTQNQNKTERHSRQAQQGPFAQQTDFHKKQSKRTKSAEEQNYDEMFKNFYKQRRDATGSENPKEQATSRTYYDGKGNKYTYTYTSTFETEQDKRRQTFDRDNSQYYSKEQNGQFGSEYFNSDKFESVRNQFFRDFHNKTKRNNNNDYEEKQAQKSKDYEEWNRERDFRNYYNEEKKDMFKFFNEDIAQAVEDAHQKVKDKFAEFKVQMEEKGLLRTVYDQYKKWFHQKDK